MQESKAAAVLGKFVEKTGLKSAATICGLQLATRFLGGLVFDFGKQIFVRMSLGTLINRFYDWATPEAEVDDAPSVSKNSAPRVTTQGSRPGNFKCPTARTQDIENKYGYGSGPTAKFNNWDSDVKPFIGQPARDAAGNPNIPKGYLFGEQNYFDKSNKLVSTQYAYLPDSPNGRVPILVTSPNGKWNVRSEKASDASARIAEDARYTLSHDRAFGRLITGNRNVHHLLADNVWRRSGLLQETMERCGKDIGMDIGENLIELASDTSSRDTATAANPGKISPIIHNTSHPKFDDHAESILRDTSKNRIGIDSSNKLDYKNVPCDKIVEVVKEAAGILRSQFLNDRLPASVLNSVGTDKFLR
jgi:hypothetical protein